MTPGLSLVVVAFAAPITSGPTGFWQVAPEHAAPPWLLTHRDRAVVLVHGLRIHPLRPKMAARPERHEWQFPKSALVRALAKDADVFAFSYAQTAPVDAIAHSAGLRQAIAELRTTGYKEIVLVGHSAGGVVARLFIESYPDAGVTKLVQVASPNTGSDLAAFVKTGYPRFQAPFIQSLAPAARFESFRKAKVLFSPKVEMVCVVCKVKRLESDFMVPIPSQWPDELQQQGIPAVLVSENHFEIMNSAEGVKQIASLACEKLTRWSPEQTEQARRVLFRDEFPAK